jgi:hypothetical protein
MNLFDIPLVAHVNVVRNIIMQGIIRNLDLVNFVINYGLPFKMKINYDENI